MRDPICGKLLHLNEAKSTGHIENYHGEVFGFCSENCQKKFREDPARYAGVKVGEVARSVHASRSE
jgi:YHS domain-containing protein